MHRMKRKPSIVGIGGTTRHNSSTEMAIRYALSVSASMGAETTLFSGPDLMFPMYAPDAQAQPGPAAAFITALRDCDGIIIGSPGYHGSISGLVKNALDYVEELKGDSRSYFDGRAVGCIVCAHGAQAAGTTLMALRSIVHALRGWPTPLGVAINTSSCRFTADGSPTDPDTEKHLKILGSQVFDFAKTSAEKRASEYSCSSQKPTAMSVLAADMNSNTSPSSAVLALLSK